MKQQESTPWVFRTNDSFSLAVAFSPEYDDYEPSYRHPPLLPLTSKS
jgi:hypothetical protein